MDKGIGMIIISEISGGEGGNFGQNDMPRVGPLSSQHNTHQQGRAILIALSITTPMHNFKNTY